MSENNTQSHLGLILSRLSDVRRRTKILDEAPEIAQSKYYSQILSSLETTLIYAEKLVRQLYVRASSYDLKKEL